MFDTETTGLPAHRNAKYTNLDAFDKCRVLSVALVEFSGDHTEVGHYYNLLKCPNVSVGATEIHGITQTDVDDNGINIEQLYCDVRMIFEGVKHVVGHNVHFDVNVLKSEFFRAGLSIDFMNNVEYIDTLKLTRNMFFSTMKLGVLYKFLFDEDFDGAHNALNDCRATARVYSELQRDPRNCSSIQAKKIWIKVSDIATITGHSHFKKPWEVIENLWSRYNPDTFVGQTLEQLKETTVKNAPEEIKTLFTSETTLETFTKACDIINNHNELTETEKSLIVQHLQKVIYTTHGIEKEDQTVSEMDFVKDDKFYRQLICTIKGTEYYMCGRVDRVELCSDGSKKLVEIKNRTKSLFNKVRDYENIQVQMYMHLNPQWKSAKLIEQFNEEKKMYEIFRDPELCSQTIETLKEFCKTLHFYMSS